MMRQIKLSKIALMATIRNGFAVGVTLVAVLTPLHAGLPFGMMVSTLFLIMLRRMRSQWSPLPRRCSPLI